MKKTHTSVCREKILITLSLRTQFIVRALSLSLGIVPGLLRGVRSRQSRVGVPRRAALRDRQGRGTRLTQGHRQLSTSAFIHSLLRFGWSPYLRYLPAPAISMTNPAPNSSACTCTDSLDIVGARPRSSLIDTSPCLSLLHVAQRSVKWTAAPSLPRPVSLC